MATEKLSPGMQQYVDIKSNIQMLLLFRMGDFMNYFMRMRSMLRRFWKFP